MLTIHISPLHNLKLDNDSGMYAMETKLVLEISNKSINPFTINNLKIVSRKKSLLSFKAKNELSQNKDKIINPQSIHQLTLEGLNFEKSRKYMVMINNEYTSNEL